MRTHLPALLGLLLAASLPACGARVVVDDEPAPTAPDASVDASTEPEEPAPCHCPDSPGHVPCVAPLECCPVVGQCKDPASFSCTGSALPCP